jgi:choline kinase
MGPYTAERPKCMLELNGRPLLAYALDALRAAGCDDVAVVTGHCASGIHAPGCALVHNDEFARNNVLHSLMYARAYLRSDVLVTYSDIFVEPDVHQRLAGTPGEIVLAVDRDWSAYYAGRDGHPVAEAEKAFVEPSTDGMTGRVRAIGKKLDLATRGACLAGEFLGLWKMTAAGAERFVARFESLDERLAPASPFHEATEWRRAYVTDLLADLIETGADVRCLLIDRGWAEFDLVDDYERLPSIIQQQRLTSLS